jgi:hypothetical protein
MGLITKGTAGSTGAGDILTIDFVPGTRVVACTLDGLYSGYEITGNTVLKENTWYHIALVKNSSNVYKLYINGKQETATYNATGTISASSNFFIGTNYYAPSDIQRQAHAYFSDVRIVSTEVYTNDFTPPTAPLTAITNTKLLTCTNKNDIWNEALGARIAKVGNVTSSNTQRKFISSSAVYLDGAGDAISFTPGYDDPLYNFGTRDWTIEGWFYIQTLAAGGKFLLSFLRASANEAVPHIWTSSTDLRYYVSGADKIIGSSALTVNTWHHIAVTRSGNDHKLFVDGTQVGSTWTNAQTYTQGRPVLGDYHTSLNTLSGAQTLHGYVQDLRITNGLARYTANFTPPTAEFDG